MPTDVVLLHNQNAGDEEHSETTLVKMLRSAGYQPEYYPLKKGLKKTAVLEKADFVVAAGGDGSIRKVALALAGTGTAVAPLPLGTANNIAHSLGLDPADPEKIVAGWKHGVRRKIDVGVAKGPWGKKHFIEGLGFGLVGRAIAIIQDIDEHSGRVFSTGEDQLHRDLCVMVALAEEMPAIEAKVTADRLQQKDAFLLLEVLNINRAGPGLTLAAGADPGDGWLDLVSARAHERRKLTQSIEKCLSESRRGPLLRARRVRGLKLSVGKCELRLDDKVVLRRKDFHGHHRIHIEVSLQRHAVEFLLPKTGRREQ